MVRREAGYHVSWRGRTVIIVDHSLLLLSIQVRDPSNHFVSQQSYLGAKIDGFLNPKSSIQSPHPPAIFTFSCSHHFARYATSDKEGVDHWCWRYTLITCSLSLVADNPDPISAFRTNATKPVARPVE